MLNHALRAFGLICCSLVLWAAPPKGPSRLIRIPVWVGSQTAGSVTKDDLRATLEGSSSEIVDIQGPEDGLMIMIVLDMVDDLSLVEPAKDALAAEIQKLGPQVYVTLLRAQDGLRVLVDPTADRVKVDEAVQLLPVSGKAGLLDTVETAERLADTVLQKASVRVAVLYITDSDVQNYREDYTNPVINSSDQHDLSRKFPEALVQEKISKVSAALAGRQAPLFVVHLRYRSERLNEAYQIGLKRLAEVTGGSSVFCRSSAEIPGAIHDTLKLISSHYSVTLAVPEKAAKNVLVQLEAEGNRTLSYRTRFVLSGR